MPDYITLDEVKTLVRGKMRFTDDAAEENKMLNSDATVFVEEAEAEVEFDLSPRYAIPFQTVDGEAFANLPLTPTQYILKLLCRLKGAIRLLETDFGAGSRVDSQKYTTHLRKRYDRTLKKILKKNNEEEGKDQEGFAYPPLDDLRLNYMNECADDGFKGAILVSGQGDGSYPQKQINDPSENWWNGIVDED